MSAVVHSKKRQPAYPLSRAISPLALISVANLGPEDSGVFLVDPRVTYIKIFLWGAGGGGGGCPPPTALVFFTFQAAGGGGAGGYVEAEIVNPLQLSPEFSYFLASGGKGGAFGVTGESAATSWFWDPAHVYATGGQGGSIGMVGDSSRSNSAPGGAGGEGGGTHAIFALKGGSGQDGIALSSMIATGGRGGAAGIKSGDTLSPSLISLGTSNGVNGLSYGGGGSGSCTFTNPDGAIGGDGANAHLMILSYGI